LSKPIVNQQIIFTYLGWWLFWTIFQIIVLHRLHFTWQIAAIDAIVSNVLLALSGYVIINTYRFYTPDEGNYLYRFSYIFVLAVLCMLSMQWLLKYLLSYNSCYLEFLNSSLPIRYMFAILMISFLGVVNWLRFYMKEQENFKQRKNEAEKLLQEAELANLRQQLQPHFLFNSLNSISALTGSRPEEARKMIQQLSDFLRGTLKNDEKQLMDFSSELEHLNLYLDIERVRFGHRLKILIDCEQTTLPMKIPSLLLQPLVENAIKFGLYDTIGEITIKINAIESEKQLRVTIENPFDLSTAKPRQGTGFGLSSVQRRLYLIYGRSDLLFVEQKENQFITIIQIPQNK
jgi:two-component system, LytTR family, sensor kinase